MVLRGVNSTIDVNSEIFTGQNKVFKCPSKIIEYQIKSWVCLLRIFHIVITSKGQKSLTKYVYLSSLIGSSYMIVLITAIILNTSWA